MCCECVCTSYDGGCPYPGNEECEAIVCETDPYCCWHRWDPICVLQSDAVCKGTQVPKCCGCTVDQNGCPGCKQDKQCEQDICRVDPYCCGHDVVGQGYWDQNCIHKAFEICKGNDYVQMSDMNDYYKSLWERRR